jgi:hypothetical protein
VLVVGDRRIPIDGWPLARSADEYRTVELARSENALVIEPKQRAGAGLAARVVLIVLGGALPGLVAAAVELPLWLAALISLVAFALLALLVRRTLSSLRWIRFDRQAKQLIFEKRVGFAKERRVERAYPLDCIRAVQLLHNGRHSITEPEGAGERQTISHREYHGYELNLVCDGAAGPRLNLLCHSDWGWVRQAGQQIGEFLGVPVLDNLYHGG